MEPNLRNINYVPLSTRVDPISGVEPYLSSSSALLVIPGCGVVVMVAAAADLRERAKDNTVPMSWIVSDQEDEEEVEESALPFLYPGDLLATFSR